MPGGDTPKVIFCTTEGEMSRITEALAAGADEYIMKPFDEEVLASKLEIVGFLNQTADAA
jgi:two-component system chemotaxis response regulator CheY